MSRRYLVLTVIIPAIVTIVAFAVGFRWVLQLPPTYASKATIAFSPRITKTGAFPSSEAVILYAGNSLGYLTSDATMTAIATKTGMDPADLVDATEVTVIPGTATVAIEVRDTSPARAAIAANAFADRLLSKSESSPTVAGESYGKAKQEETASGPPRTILAMAVGVISLLAGLLTFTLMIMFGRIRMAGGLIPVLRALTTPSGTGTALPSEDGDPAAPPTAATSPEPVPASGLFDGARPTQQLQPDRP